MNRFFKYPAAGIAALALGFLATNVYAGVWSAYTPFTVGLASSAVPYVLVTDAGQVRIGTTTNYAGNPSRLFVWGGGSGANIDVMGDPSVAGGDQATIELESSSFPTTVKSVYLQYVNHGIGTSLGFANTEVGKLVFGGDTNLIYTPGVKPLIFGTDSTERLRISETGNLGIGTTSPYAKLSVAGQTVSEYFTATSTTATSTLPLLSSTKFVLGTLNGPLQANSGVVSATTSIGVVYGGTGLTSAPAYGQLLVGNSSGGYALTATSSLGLATGALTFTYPLVNTANTVSLGFGTTTSNAWSQLQAFSSGINVNGETLTDLTGAGLSNAGGALTLNATGDWTGTFDGQDGSYYLARANQTGTQTASTVSDFSTAARGLISSTATGLTYTSGTGVFSLTSGYGIPLTASTTNWNSFYGTPSTRITAGTGLGWSGNTLSVSTSSLASEVFLRNGNSFGALATLGTNDSNALAFETGGMEALRILTNGNIGIGTTTPADDLAVQGLGISLYDEDAMLRARLHASPGTAGILSLVNPEGYEAVLETGDGYLQSSGAFAIRNDTDGAGNPALLVQGASGQAGPVLSVTQPNSSNIALLQVLPNGNVGIGTSSPLSKLHVSGGQARLPNGSVVAGNNSGIAFDSYGDTGLAANDDNLAFRESGVISLVLTNVLKEIRIPSDYAYSFSSATNNNAGSDASLFRQAAGIIRTAGAFIVDGKLGVGTSSPQTKLHVSSGASATTTVTIGELGLTSSTSCVNMNRSNGAPASFYINAAGAMIVETSYCR